MISSQELCTVRPLLCLLWVCTWWRHQMETFSALLVLCAGNSPVSGEFPAQRPMKRSFDVFFDLRLTKRLSKHSRGWWFETLSRSLSRHCNDLSISKSIFQGHFVGTVLQHRGPISHESTTDITVALVLFYFCYVLYFRTLQSDISSHRKNYHRLWKLLCKCILTFVITNPTALRQVTFANIQDIMLLWSRYIQYISQMCTRFCYALFLFG